LFAPTINFFSLISSSIHNKTESKLDDLSNLLKLLSKISTCVPHNKAIFLFDKTIQNVIKFECEFLSSFSIQ
jgi:hypothetical protein